MIVQLNREAVGTGPVVTIAKLRQSAECGQPDIHQHGPVRPAATRMIPGTEGYAEHAAELVKRFEAVSFAEKHAAVMHLLPSVPSTVLDVGAGSGADAAWFASKGYRVVAVEPTDALRLAGLELHRAHPFEWVDDSLPDLARMRARDERFDVVMLTAVWMHLDELERQRAMPRLASLLAPAGILVMSIRHGPAPSERRIFDLSDEETIALALGCSLKKVFGLRTASVQAANRPAGVTWSRLAFQRVT
ncbi:class I SAM-dependent methyltransferase [Variovorax ureilyticus]|uniref:class I SAM-dependent methyltransferase n=1 Tax=Variovorax ureilyticus TaxID=1836198 RepID=UPI003D67C13E